MLPCARTSVFEAARWPLVAESRWICWRAVAVFSHADGTVRFAANRHRYPASVPDHATVATELAGAQQLSSSRKLSLLAVASARSESRAADRFRKRPELGATGRRKPDRPAGQPAIRRAHLASAQIAHPAVWRALSCWRCPSDAYLAACRQRRSLPGAAAALSAQAS